MACSSSALPSLLFFSFLISSTLPVYSDSAAGFSVALIHRDSPQSPYYNPLSTRSDRVHAAAKRSISRAHRLASFVSTAALNDSSSFESQVFPNSFEYLMSLSIGTPPFKILAIADTGSDLTWTQCKPCDECYKQTDPLFDPTQSSTYQKLSCEAESCEQLPANGCGDDSTCQYHYTYGDGSSSDGVLSVETFTFDSEGKTGVSIPAIKFGCTHASKGTFESHGSGLVGLGGGPLSFISQLGSTINKKFSYCLVPYQEIAASSMLNFGDSAMLHDKNVVTTPLISGTPDTFYYLQLTEVIVENNTIPVNSVQEGNIIIDSGTTLTLFDEQVHSNLVNALQKIIDLPPTRDPEKLFDLCYEAFNGVEKKLPDITLRFSGEADVVLSPLNTFTKTKEGVVCLAFVAAPPTGLPILGNIAQQNFHIEYDLGKQQLSFARADCANL